MKLSIVTISYNQHEFLKECIDSVLSQRSDLRDIGVDLEYIVVDPGSTDGSRELIESYGDQVIKIFEIDDGPADGLNKGFDLATGDIFAYLNADDYFLPGSLVEAALFITNHNYDLIYGHGWIVDEFGAKLHRSLSHKFTLDQYVLGNCVVMQQSTFFKRDIYFKAGGFNPLNKVSWDGELLVDMVISGAKIKRVNLFLSAFRVYGASISGSGKYLELSKKEQSRVAKKIHLGDKELKSAFFRKILHRIFDPYYLFIRIIDGIQYGKRKIPFE